MGLSEASTRMLSIFLLTLCLALTSGLRGPHHPRSPASHHHYSPQKDVKITQDSDLLQDATHLKEDMGPMADQLDFSKMTEQEIEFYYFKVHDHDNNTKLDGLELLNALQHTLHDNMRAEAEQDENQEHPKDPKDQYDLSWIVELIDRVLEEDDLDHDGYLGYVEYVLGRQRDHIAMSRRGASKLKVKK